MYKAIDNLTRITTNNLNNKTSKQFKMYLVISLFLVLQSFIAVYFTLKDGLDIWGINNKTAWGISITNFVFWIGISHSGTLISAILFLFKQNWRSSISRASEAMTLISIICAGIFLLIHTGRPWLSWLWIVPYPSQFGIWVNFKSPLFWDFIAILTYFTVSLLYWYLGMLPDLAYLKSRVKNPILKAFYRFFAFGWKGDRFQWEGYNRLYMITAGAATALVISVHSIVSMDFALTALPGWHSTIFPPYFVAGAIFSGCAMLVIILAAIRNAFNLQDYIKAEHFEKINKIIFYMSWIVTFSYFIEIFSTMFNTNVYEDQILHLKIKNSLFWIMVAFNCFIPQLYLFKSMRKNIKVSVTIGFLITIGMWLERFFIIIMSQKTGIIDAVEIQYYPSIYEISIFLGSIGLFIFFYLIFLKFIPIIPIWETANEENRLRNTV